MSADFDVVVVGGGLAGLTAGATAARAGASVAVLEAHQPGGRAQTDEREGFTFNRGVHAFFTGGRGQIVLDTLGVRLAGAAPPLDGYVLLAEGEHHVLPLTPDGVAATTYLGPTDKAQLAAVFQLVPALDPRDLRGVSTERWLADLDLRPRVDTLLRTLLRLSTYTADLAELGADAGVAQQQMAAKSGVLYLDGGWSQLTGALRAMVPVHPRRAVRLVTADSRGAEVHTDEGVYRASTVVLATGTPAAALAVLPHDPGWGDLGEPVTAACLDVATRVVPTPGYVVSADEPLYGTVQSPPALQSPPGSAVVGVIRYGARDARADRASLTEHLGQVGVQEPDVVAQRFLARMVVSSTLPRATRGGLDGRPAVTASGLPRVLLAGDWVGPEGLLADAALASGHAAGLAAAAGAGATLPARVA